MSHSAHYRRLHYLHLDVITVAVLAAAGWFIWPSVPSTSRREPLLPQPSVAYGEVDPRTVGSVLYPGHFAFSSPIGFGAMSNHRSAAEPRWSVGPLLPLTPALPRTEPDEFPPPTPALALPRLPPVGPPVRRVTPRPSAEFLEVELCPVLQSRAFSLPEATASQLAGTNAPAGDVRAYVRLDGEGRVAHVLFPPSDLAWPALRPLEILLLRATASHGNSATDGWVRVRWQASSVAPRLP